MIPYRYNEISQFSIDIHSPAKVSTSSRQFDVRQEFRETAKAEASESLKSILEFILLDHVVDTPPGKQIIPVTLQGQETFISRQGKKAMLLE